jgi:hypothetical protein
VTFEVGQVIKIYHYLDFPPSRCLISHAIAVIIDVSGELVTAESIAFVDEKLNSFPIAGMVSGYMRSLSFRTCEVLDIDEMQARILYS